MVSTDFAKWIFYNALQQNTGGRGLIKWFITAKIIKKILPTR